MSLKYEMTGDQQLLYRIRRKVLDECHEKQKTLDELDFLIYREDKS